MSSRTRTAALAGAVLVASAILAWRSSSYWSGDYPVESGPVIDALIHGRIGEFLSGRPLMGPLSLVLRAPFAALSLATGGGGPLDLYDSAYRFGVFPCAVAGGLLGLVLFRIAERDGRSPLVKYGAFALCTVNPLTLKALTYGHPEEILAGALLAGAMLAAVAQRALAASVLVVLAIATKQWALLGLPAVAFALPWSQLKRPLLVMAGLALLATLPLLLADPGSFLRLNRDLLDVRTAEALPTSIWWLFLPAADARGAAIHDVTPFVGLLAHPLIIAVSVALPLALRRRVRADLRARALPLLALVLLLRCALDPIDNSYYHLPFLLALIAADVLAGSVLPSLVATAWALLLINLAPHAGLQAGVYVVTSAMFAVYLAGRAAGYGWTDLIRSLAAPGPVVVRPTRPSSSGVERQSAR